MESVIIQTSRFTSNLVTSENLVYTQHLLTVIDCLFDRNHISGNNIGALYNSGNVSVTDSNFTDGSGEGYAIVGLHQNVNISDCTFRNHIHLLYTIPPTHSLQDILNLHY